MVYKYLFIGLKAPHFNVTAGISLSWHFTFSASILVAFVVRLSQYWHFAFGFSINFRLVGQKQRRAYNESWHQPKLSLSHSPTSPCLSFTQWQHICLHVTSFIVLHFVPGPKMSSWWLSSFSALLSFPFSILLSPRPFSLRPVILCLHAPLCKHTAKASSNKNQNNMRENKGYSIFGGAKCQIPLWDNPEISYWINRVRKQ